MKGVIVSAGLGTRLNPITRIISKNLLPVYDKPMIYYGIETLKKAGVTEILLVVNKLHIKQYKKLINSAIAISNDNGSFCLEIKQFLYSVPSLHFRPRFKIFTECDKGNYYDGDIIICVLNVDVLAKWLFESSKNKTIEECNRCPDTNK